MSDMPERLLAWPSNHNYQRVSLAGGRPNDAVEYVRINAIPAAQPTVSPELLATTNDVAALVDAVENLLIGIGMGWDLDGVCEVTTAALARVKGVM